MAPGRIPEAENQVNVPGFFEGLAEARRRAAGGHE